MGTNRIVEEMKQNNLPEPEFQNLSGGFEVILTGPGKAFEKEIEKEKFHKLEINERQKKAIEYIKEKGAISRKEYVVITDISPRQANKDLKDLLKKKVIVPIGKGRNIKYVVHD